MKTDFKVKYLQYLNNKKRESGFTLIELLVVIIIIGILAAIALPSFLSQANKAKQSEGKQYVASISKSQQAYTVEYVGFATSLAQLGIGLKTETSNFTYGIAGGGSGSTSTVSYAAPKGQWKSYYGGVYIVPADGTSQSFICESTGVAIAPQTSGTGCATNFTAL